MKPSARNLPPPVQIGRLVRVSNRADVEVAAGLATTPGMVVMDATDWQSIPAENLVAAFTVRSSRCLRSGQGRSRGQGRGGGQGTVKIEAKAKA